MPVLPRPSAPLIPAHPFPHASTSASASPRDDKISFVSTAITTQSPAPLRPLACRVWIGGAARPLRGVRSWLGDAQNRHDQPQNGVNVSQMLERSFPDSHIIQSHWLMWYCCQPSQHFARPADLLQRPRKITHPPTTRPSFSTTSDACAVKRQVCIDKSQAQVSVLLFNWCKPVTVPNQPSR